MKSMLFMLAAWLPKREVTGPESRKVHRKVRKAVLFVEKHGIGHVPSPFCQD